MRVISYNILAQRYVRDYPAVTNPEILLWDYRLALILKSIVAENPDIILLQEVELETFEKDFASSLAEYSVCRHIVNKNRKNPIGNVILWRNHLVPQSQMTTSCSVIVEFETFWVVNVHLKAQILRGEAQRQTQIRSVLKKLDHQKAGFIAGDFNDFLNAGCLYDVKTLGLVMAELEHFVAKAPRAPLSEEHFVAKAPRAPLSEEHFVAKAPCAPLSEEHFVAKAPCAPLSEEHFVAKASCAPLSEEHFVAKAPCAPLSNEPYQLEIHSCINSAYVYSYEFAAHNYWTFDHVVSNKLAIKLRERETNELIPFPNETEPSDHLMMIFEFA